MKDRSVRLALIGAGLIIVIAAGVMWKMQSSRVSNIRPGIDTPWRGM